MLRFNLRCFCRRCRNGCGCKESCHRKDAVQNDFNGGYNCAHINDHRAENCQTENVCKLADNKSDNCGGGNLKAYGNETPAVSTVKKEECIYSNESTGATEATDAECATEATGAVDTADVCDEQIQNSEDKITQESLLNGQCPEPPDA